MNPKATAASNWLSLGEAARELGVHPSSLRRWADSGAVDYRMTPGGHRRFAREQLESLFGRAVNGMDDISSRLAERALARTRTQLASTASSEAVWLNLDPEVRQRHRQLGKRALGVTMRFLVRPEDGVLAEARSLGADYADLARDAGLPLRAVMQACTFFRDALLDSALALCTSGRRADSALRNLIRRINRVFDELQLAIADRL